MSLQNEFKQASVGLNHPQVTPTCQPYTAAMKCTLNGHQYFHGSPCNVMPLIKNTTITKMPKQYPINLIISAISLTGMSFHYYSRVDMLVLVEGGTTLQRFV